MIDAAIRDKTACMMRVRNESRWIRRSLERTFEVARSVVLWDDGSTDGTCAEVVRWLAEGGVTTETGGDFSTFFGEHPTTRLPVRLHILHSPFRKPGAVRPREQVNEIRDKNMLWYYCKSHVDFTYMLCLDGDEMLSHKALTHWPAAIDSMREGNDIINVPFIYLWDSETKRRVDGIYGDLPGSGIATLNFPRLFSIERVHEDDLFDMMFKWEGTKGGFHCGSIPRQGFRRDKRLEPVPIILDLPIVHFGYIDDPLRQTKYIFYNQIDPGNVFEGEYRHIIGQPDVHAPGPVRLVEWCDE